ncbi:hypothetical protein ASD65_13130 [Microbacterium sp. Root61]|uniref:MBL fold metallo-hydrolase n=1 Tax=Microbacterium sp. Root61 TaxID=1736570 RepID=UPI0006FF9DBA|nr:MBL fold metallo-hydrolase [Microbacterium sp. Root61]KRA25258.1 hypothetical protein ASD65_13130 [Microbacterium sp. Root61]
MKATSERQATAWARRIAPAPEEVRPGLWAIALPAGGNPIAYTIDYVFITDDGIALVDTGWATEASATALAKELAAIGYSITDISAILITHMHPDHFGLVPRILRANPDCRLFMHDADLRLVDGRSDALRQRTTPRWQELMVSVGAPGSYEITTRAMVTNRVDDDIASQVVTLAPDQVITLGSWSIRALWTPGHTPGHLCFLVEDHALLISGDHILPTITPQVTQLSDPADDILGNYLSSLRALRSLDVVEVLPAHQYRFTGLVERIDELLAHHERRFALLENAAARSPGLTCYDLAHALDWRDPLVRMPTDQARMAVKETLAHLVHMQGAGRISARIGPPTTWWAADVMTTRRGIR